MLKKERKSLNLIAEVLFESITFTAIEYLLICCMYAFRQNIFWVFLGGLNASVVAKYWSNLKRVIPNNKCFYAIVVADFLLVGGVFLTLGYLEISTVFKEVT